MASNKSGVFTLVDVGERQETGSWDTASNVWMIGSPVIVGEGSPYGYFGGSGTIIQRLDYKNDSLILAYRGQWNYRQSSGNLAAAIANQSYGYFCGGSPSGSTTLEYIVTAGGGGGGASYGGGAGAGTANQGFAGKAGGGNEDGGGGGGA